MTAPSNANTSGLEVVAYLEVSKAGMGRRACLHQRKETPTMLRRWSSEPLVTAASAQARIDAAEARADRLAKGVTGAKLILTPEPGDTPLTEREKTARQYLAALQQETQP